MTERIQKSMGQVLATGVVRPVRDDYPAAPTSGTTISLICFGLLAGSLCSEPACSWLRLSITRRLWSVIAGLLGLRWQFAGPSVITGADLCARLRNGQPGDRNRHTHERGTVRRPAGRCLETDVKSALRVPSFVRSRSLHLLNIRIGIQILNSKRIG